MVGTATEFVIRFLSEFNQLRPYFYQAHNEVIAIRQLAEKPKRSGASIENLYLTGQQ